MRITKVLNAHAIPSKNELRLVVVLADVVHGTEAAAATRLDIRPTVLLSVTVDVLTDEEAAAIRQVAGEGEVLMTLADSDPARVLGMLEWLMESGLDEATEYVAALDGARDELFEAATEFVKAHGGSS